MELQWFQAWRERWFRPPPIDATPNWSSTKLGTKSTPPMKRATPTEMCVTPPCGCVWRMVAAKYFAFVAKSLVLRSLRKKEQEYVWSGQTFWASNSVFAPPPNSKCWAYPVHNNRHNRLRTTSYAPVPNLCNELPFQVLASLPLELWRWTWPPREGCAGLVTCFRCL